MDNPNQVERQASLVEHLAIEAYRAYGEVTEFKNYQGLPMPTWAELPEKIKSAWIAAAHCIASIINPNYANAQTESKSTPWTYAFDKRQMQEVEFAKVYARDFAHGTDGHNAKLIIAAMANLLDANEAQALPY